MTQALQHRVFVDGNNVMGYCPDRWWRDRAEAARRLIAEITPLALDLGGLWTTVFDGQAPGVGVRWPEGVGIRLGAAGAGNVGRA